MDSAGYICILHAHAHALLPQKWRKRGHEFVKGRWALGRRRDNTVNTVQMCGGLDGTPQAHIFEYLVPSSWFVGRVRWCSLAEGEVCQWEVWQSFIPLPGHSLYIMFKGEDVSFQHPTPSVVPAVSCCHAMMDFYATGTISQNNLFHPQDTFGHDILPQQQENN